MDIEDAVMMPRNETWRQYTHETGQYNPLGARCIQGLTQCRIEGCAVRVCLVGHQRGRNPGIRGSFECFRSRNVGDHDLHVRVKRTRGNGIEYGLQIAAIA